MSEEEQLRGGINATCLARMFRTTADLRLSGINLPAVSYRL